MEKIEITTDDMVQETVSPKVYSEEEYLTTVTELNDKYIRLYSEFDNFRKRTLKDNMNLSQTLSEKMIIALLPILDDFDRAIEHDHINMDGFQLIYTKLKSIFVGKGLGEIKSIGENFNTDFHEAVATVPAENVELKNKVVAEAQKGYTLNDKVIRYAKVITAV